MTLNKFSGKINQYEDSQRILMVLNQSPNFFVDADLNIRLKGAACEKNRQTFFTIVNEGSKISAGLDKVGSRTLWYYSDKRRFIISTSQRAIVSIIGNYQANPEVWSWMLSTGSLGPGLSWDKRIAAVPSGATLEYDLLANDVNILPDKWIFSNERAPNDFARNGNELAALLDEISEEYKLHDVRTLLTLSGGYDSRAALFLLKKNNPELRTATWGIPAAFKKKLTDATVARQVSKSWNIHHSEYNVQLSGDIESAIDSFLEAGEGRNDHINTFMDGLNMWKSIGAAGYQWVVRADEAFGWLPVRTELDVRTSVAFNKLSDFINIPKNVIASLPEQKEPSYLQRLPGELPEDWRDRLYQQYRLPFVIGPLQDLPLNFVEILNPLLHDKVVEFVRTLPAKQRTKKLLYANWVNSLLPNVQYALAPAIPESANISLAGKNRTFFLDFLHSRDASTSFSAELLNYIKPLVEKKDQYSESLNSRMRSKLLSLTPLALKKLIRNRVTGYQINEGSLALRTYIIYLMQKKMKQ